MLILVDQDGPLADLEAAVIEIVAVASDGRYRIDVADRVGFRMTKDYGRRYGAEAASLVAEVMARPGLYRQLPLVPGAGDALEAMMAAGHEVRICTSPLSSNPSCASDKLAWVEEHLGPEWVGRTIIADDKTWVRGDVLIDDRPDVAGSLVPTWQLVIFDASYNRDRSGPRLCRWAEWQTVARSTVAHARLDHDE